MMKNGAREPRVRKSKREKIARRLTAWYRERARDLPWRRNRTPYTALVAEAMLQQTQAARVAERFDSFIARFPTVHALAATDEQDVLALWQGLGYYRRARHLHTAAKLIVEEFDGSIPDDVDQLMRLPGVGRYTAGAIASLVFGRTVPIVDGNVRRVLARLFAHDGLADNRSFDSRVWSIARDLVESADDPAAFNEGLMELGAVVCAPVNPQCDACPLARVCAAKRENRQAEIPSPRPGTQRKSVHHHACIIRNRGRILFERRPADGLWGNMWQTPTIEADRELSVRALCARLTVSVRKCQKCGWFRHDTTHRRITFHVFTAESERKSRNGVKNGVWRGPDNLDDLPMSSAQRRIIREFAAARYTV